MKVLGSFSDHRDIWFAPVGMLTPLAVVSETPTPPDLWDDLDANGMRNPLVCWPMTAATWARWCATRPKAREVVPRWVLGAEVMRSAGEVDAGAQDLARLGLLWVVHVGNQRLKYAEARGYTHIAAVLCQSHQKAVEWVGAFYV